MTVYLDNSATTKPSEAVLRAAMRAMEEGWHNPSALYRPALEAQKEMEETRRRCLAAAGAAGQRLVFTGSGTEADNLAILGYLRGVKKPGRALILQVEHPAVRACAPEIERLGHRVEALPTDQRGVCDLPYLEKTLAEDVRLICVMQVNNETGAIQPLREICALRDRLAPEAAIHVDGVQGFLRVPISFAHLGIQSYAFSGHKIHAPKGIGGLVFRKDHKLRPIVFGGGQEGDLRSGTENTMGIAALGAAVDSFDPDAPARMSILKKRLWETLKAGIPAAEVNGPMPGEADSAPHILNVSLTPVRSQTMLFALEGEGVYVSAGSACASHKQKVSPVLSAMGIDSRRADCALRFSLSPMTTEAEIDQAAEAAIMQYSVLSKYVRR